MILLEENTLELTIHGVQITLLIGITGFLLKQHKVWIRIKDRLDMVWRQFCLDHNIPYKGIENHEGD